VVTDPDEESRELERLLAILAQLYAAVEASGGDCPFCTQAPVHSTDCPVGIAWGLLDEEVHAAARDQVRPAVCGWARRKEGEPDWPDFLGEE
jgi:hypothetical protein